MPLNLSALGLELDNVRRARRGEPVTTGISPPSAANAPLDPEFESETAGRSASTSTSPQTSANSSPDTSPQIASLPPQENPYPLCLLCFSRTPSAVLLPCAHLNLCYLCAPLLMHKSRPCPSVAAADQAPAAPAREPAAEAEPELDPRRDGRLPFNVALSRALASRPAASGPGGQGTRRRLSIGGYVPPKEGHRGGEMRGTDLLPPTDGVATDDSVGLARTVDENGQVRVALSGSQAAQCLVCRQGVSGWLRVYSG